MRCWGAWRMLDLSGSILHVVLAHLSCELLIWLLTCTWDLLDLLLALALHLLLLHHLLLLLLKHFLLFLDRWAVPGSTFLIDLLSRLNMVAYFIEWSAHLLSWWWYCSLLSILPHLLLLLLLRGLLIDELISSLLILEEPIVLTVLCFDDTVHEIALQLSFLELIRSCWHHLVTVRLHYTLILNNVHSSMWILLWWSLIIIVSLRFSVHASLAW